MFKKQLKTTLIRIFGIENTTFEEPQDTAPEQDVLFIEIIDAKTRAYGRDRIGAKVTGTIILYSQDERTPYGFFSKKVEQASGDDRRKFFFGREIDIQESQARIQNIHEKQVPFTFLYDSQYDPNRGELSSIDLSIQMEN